MTDKSPKEIHDMIKRPSSNFTHAGDVVETEHLTKAQKAKALENWEADSRRLAVATEEGMGGGETSHATDISEAQVSLKLKGKKSRSPTKIG